MRVEISCVDQHTHTHSREALPIRLLHGGSHENWWREYELDECVPVMPFAKQLETELARVRHDVYV